MGLLPTERGPYSTKDGSLSWKTMKEASLSLLRGEVDGANGKKGGGGTTSIIIRRGWSYHEEERGHYTADNMEKSQKEEDEYECSAGSGGDDTAGDNEYCGFVPCIGAEDGPTDENGWQYYPDFLPQSLLSPNRKRYVELLPWH